MANIAISEINESANTLKDDDYVLVSSKNTNGSFTSAKMLGSVLKSSVSSTYDDTELKEMISGIQNQLTTMNNSNNSYFARIFELNTKIGNKIFSGEIGETKYTLTLTNTDNLASAPTGGGQYNSGTRIIITAGTPKDPQFVQFKGWYQDNVLVSSMSSDSYEVTCDVTLDAKYQDIFVGKVCRGIRGKFKVVNQTDRNVSFSTYNSYYYYPNVPRVDTVALVNANETKDINIILGGSNVVSEYYSMDYVTSSGFVNISCSMQGVSSDINRVYVDDSIAYKVYDGTYKDYGTLTITR